MWGQVIYNAIVSFRLFKYLKLVEMAIGMVLGSVETEHTFSTMNFIKFKFHKWLTTNLDLVVYIYEQQFYMMQIFPLYITTCEVKGKKWYGKKH
jgi:hypothetical protein